MTAQTETSRRHDLIAANLAAVETHFHNETSGIGRLALYVRPDGGPGGRLWFTALARV